MVPWWYIDTKFMSCCACGGRIKEAITNKPNSNHHINFYKEAYFINNCLKFYCISLILFSLLSEFQFLKNNLVTWSQQYNCRHSLFWRYNLFCRKMICRTLLILLITLGRRLEMLQVWKLIFWFIFKSNLRCTCSWPKYWNRRQLGRHVSPYYSGY